MSCLHILLLNAFSQAHPNSVPLGIAAEMGHKQTVERLLKEQVDINHQDEVRNIIMLYNAYALQFNSTIHNMSLQDFLIVTNVYLFVKILSIK